MKPKPISDSDVRITDISVRSALMRVRWNDMPVRRADSSVDMRSEADFPVTASIVMTRLSDYCDAGWERQRRAMRAIGPRRMKYGTTASASAMITASSG